MLLIADSGSTKCDWALKIAGDKKYIKTSGLNPNICDKEEFIGTLESEQVLFEHKFDVTEIQFYGAGCISTSNQDKVKSWLREFFTSAETVLVKSDLVATQKALLGDGKGIIAILGTGSNLGYFDGAKMHFPIRSLGYILSDEGSGVAIGKALLKDYFYGDMPEEYASKMRWQNDVELHLQSEFPNAFIASKVLEFDEYFYTDYFNGLVKRELSKFVELHKKTIEKYGGEVNFVGSISFVFREFLAEVLSHYGFKIGKVIRAPIEHLE